MKLQFLQYFPSEWQEKLESPESRWLALGFFGLFALLTFYLLMHFIWGLFSISSPTPEAASSSLHVPQNTGVKLAEIPNWHLMGEYDVVDPNDLPNSLLNYKIQATFVASPSRFSYALITTDNGTSHLYKQGDSLEGEIKVVKILEKCVVLRNEDKLESLCMPTAPSIFGAPPSGINFDTNPSVN